MADLVTTPHFKMPFTFRKSGVAVLEQDDDDEVFQTATTVLRYEAGERQRIPEYGIPDYSLRMNGVDLVALRAIIYQWDDRVDVEDEQIMQEAQAIVEVHIGRVTENG